MTSAVKVFILSLSSATTKWYTEQSIPHFCMAQNCGRSFMRKLDLSIHVQTHDKDTWQCAECDWTTTCKKYLQAHLIRHEEDLRYKCDQCDKKCKFREQL